MEKSQKSSKIYLSSFLIIILLSITLLSVNAKDDQLKQHPHETDTSDFVCSKEFQLILKQSTGTPYCVKPSSVEKLIQRGWGIHTLSDYSNVLQLNLKD